MVNTKIEAVLWDFDGAIVNSIPIMEECWDNVRQHFELASSISFDVYKQHIGRPFEEIMAKVGIEGADAQTAKNLYFSCDARNTVPEIYPGIKGVIADLFDRNYKQTLVTSKDKSTTLFWLKELDLLSKFQDVQTPDFLPKEFGKPNPHYITASLAAIECPPNRALYLGDMEVDYEASTRAGTFFGLTSWGYGNFDINHPAKILSKPQDILTYIESINLN